MEAANVQRGPRIAPERYLSAWQQSPWRPKRPRSNYERRGFPLVNCLPSLRGLPTPGGKKKRPAQKQRQVLREQRPRRGRSGVASCPETQEPFVPPGLVLSALGAFFFLSPLSFLSSPLDLLTLVLYCFSATFSPCFVFTSSDFLGCPLAAGLFLGLGFV